MVADCKFPSSHICPCSLGEPGSSEDLQRNVCKDGCTQAGVWFLKLNDRNRSADGALVGEARDEAGTGQGEEEGGEPLRKSWTICSFSLSVARFCPGPVGPRAGPGPRCRGQDVPLPLRQLTRSYTYSHALFFCHCVCPLSSLFWSRAQESQVHSRSHTGDRKCRPSQPSCHFRWEQSKGMTDS